MQDDEKYHITQHMWDSLDEDTKNFFAKWSELQHVEMGELAGAIGWNLPHHVPVHMNEMANIIFEHGDFVEKYTLFQYMASTIKEIANSKNK